MRQQAGASQTFIDEVCWSGYLGQGFVLGTRPFTSDMTVDLGDTRDVVELFSDVFTDALQLAAAGTGGGLGSVMNFNAGQVDSPAHR